MKAQLLTLVASLALTCSANAALVVTVPAAIDQTVFNGQAHGLLGDVTIDGMTFSGDAIVESGRNVTAIPVPWSIRGSDDNALVLGAGQTETVVFDHAQTHLLAAWYTPDTYNGVQLNDGMQVTGGLLSSLGFAVNPDTAPNAAMLLVDISGFGTPFTQATFYSTGNSFEFVVNDDASGLPATPEASTFLMMLMGFAALGYAASKRARLAVVGA
jgi:hypothetical protein